MKGQISTDIMEQLEELQFDIACCRDDVSLLQECLQT